VPTNPPDLTGKVIVITGANSGIGAATALGLAHLGATLILACRNVVAAGTAAQDIRHRTGNDAVRCVELDLADLDSVHRCADELTSTTDGIDVLINNAGGAFTARTVTAQGFEQTFGVNYLGPYALTRLLLAHLQQPARVISVSSLGHKYCRAIRWDDLTFSRGYTSMGAYSNAKLAQVLFTAELARRTDAFSAAVHPGFVASEFYNKGNSLPARGLQSFARRFAKTPDEGAQTSIYLASTDVATLPNGGYWASCRPARPSKAARDQAAAQRLWQLSEELVARSGITFG